MKKVLSVTGILALTAYIAIAFTALGAAVTQRIQGSYVPCYVNNGVGTAASNNATSCYAVGGIFKGIHAVNTTTTIAYVRLYDLAAAPTCSSSTGFIESIPVPVAANGPLVAPANESFFKGFAYCVTGGGGNNDNTNAVAGVYITMDFLPAH